MRWHIPNTQKKERKKRKRRLSNKNFVSVKPFFRIKGELKTLPDKQKLRGYIMSRNTKRSPSG